jgi:hypothetical protein
LYRRNIVVDGNFSLEQMKMKKPNQDIFLNDGCGYMVASAPYQRHLQDSTESREVSLSYVGGLHFCLFLPIISDLLVPTTRLSIKPMQIEGIYKPQVWVHVHVLAMGALFPIQ